MALKAINIVWLKRDLRTQDHEPLYWAEQSDLPYLIIYIYEPTLIQYPDTSQRHLQFIYHSILEMNQRLKTSGQEVKMMYGEAEDVFNYLAQQFDINQVFSYQETGIQITYDRDKKMHAFFKENGIVWQEYQRDGIVRGIRNREGWDKQWHQKINQPIILNEFQEGKKIHLEHPFSLSTEFINKLADYPDKFQPAGEKYAWRYLASFTKKRGVNYHWHISKPSESRTSCARISPYLSWGNVTIRQVYQYIKKSSLSKHKKAYAGILSRLKWHCHFIQKFEVECSYETACINRGFEILAFDKNPSYFEAWKKGATGFPLIDACMQCLQQTGWINFRMRAMLVSFLCHHLFLDWRTGVYHLAQLFLDYEPGIHYPQFQMQAGTTGVNTIRMYNPVKQSQDHDPEGVFIKKWLPQLSKVPAIHIHEPWKMTSMEQTFISIQIGKDYPLPIVDLKKAGARARKLIWEHRKHKLVLEDKLRILKTHTRRSK